ncbi:glycosyltransferase, partial [Chamaesiphon sp. VAR_48_metabat_135_sub]|uniref:glycosyltransferase n=1 Tax=Chamaesiphon sp. VAR_48_metabat_135_sub TaxID=2964699 RepID=UPI00286C5A41
LLIDVSTWKGHHEIYFKNILLTLNKDNYFVYAVCADNMALRQWMADMNLQNCQILDVKLSSIDKILLKVVAAIDNILLKLSIESPFQYLSIGTPLCAKSLFKQIGKQIPVFFAHADSAIPAVPLWLAKIFLPNSWIALSIQPSYQAAISIGKHKSRQRFASEQLFALPSCKAVLALHPIYQNFFEKRFKQSKFLVFPEIVDVEISEKSEIADRIQNLAGGRKIISTIGSLLPKRNLKLFLESARKLDSSEYFILVVGRFPKQGYSTAEIEYIQKLLLNFSTNSYIDLDYYIPDETEFNKLLAISDLIYLQYKDHSCSSNILSKAIELRKPILVNSGYLMEKVVRTYDWEAIVPEDPEIIAKEIINLVHNFTINEEKYSQFLSDYNAENNRLAICKALEFL